MQGLLRDETRLQGLRSTPRTEPHRIAARSHVSSSLVD
jgi:hypothetical protein